MHATALHVRLLKLGPEDWEFDFPRVTREVRERFEEAVDAMGEDDHRPAEAAFRAVIADVPEFIDARHHLAVLLDATRRPAKALEEWKTAVEIGMQALPLTFVLGRDRLQWGLLDNRPFLRACHGLALAYERRSLLGEAYTLYENLLDLNPDDNQGVRQLALACLFGLRRPGRVLELCDRLGFDDMVLMYGRALALHLLGEKKRAREAARAAATAFPHVAKEFAKEKHVPIESKYPGFITFGGEDEAYAFWLQFGHFWAASGALALLPGAKRSS